MRGFTILLVVMWHVSLNVLIPAQDCYSLNGTFALFRMPLFFFVSGFVLYKAGRKWDISESCQFLRKKVTVQILSPLIFMSVIAIVFKLDLVEMFFDPSKGGYWFTFTLFEYFVAYILVQQVLKLISGYDWLKDAFLLSVGLVVSPAAILLYQLFSSGGGMDVVGLLSVVRGVYFMFFIIGTLVRKHYTTVESLLDKKYTVAVLLVSFVVLCLLLECYDVCRYDVCGFDVCRYGLSKSAGLIGVFLVLSIFRRYRNELDKTNKVGYVLQYVGRRTLDIYLIHYFIIRSNLKTVLPNFSALQAPFAEFILSFLVAVVIIACCLLVSAVIRTSPFMAHLLFGQKYPR